MDDLKVGSRVYIKKGHPHDHGGLYGIIIEKTNDMIFDWNVRTSSGNTVCFYKHELELDKNYLVKNIIKDIL